ncbi:hypothetical protein CLF_111969 [Clonorchis sinensis]|uniref:Uncharacterized protein n=1 Tax=Clonorchis sinensis TaxID=79923 RepID=G7YM60_CLOSI|nr:hypothetical protein CLF_111969 [Clonorchis sinensis]
MLRTTGDERSTRATGGAAGIRTHHVGSQVLKDLENLRACLRNMEREISLFRNIKYIACLLNPDATCDPATLEKASILIDTIVVEICQGIECRHQVLVFNAPDRIPLEHTKTAILTACGRLDTTCTARRLRISKPSTCCPIILQLQDENDAATGASMNEAHRFPSTNHQPPWPIANSIPYAVVPKPVAPSTGSNCFGAPMVPFNSQCNKLTPNNGRTPTYSALSSLSNTTLSPPPALQTDFLLYNSRKLQTSQLAQKSSFQVLKRLVRHVSKPEQWQQQLSTALVLVADLLTCCISAFHLRQTPLRSDADFRTRMQEKHHTGPIPVEEVNFPMIDGVPPNYMHSVCLGSVRNFLILLRAMPIGHKYADVLIDVSKFAVSKFAVIFGPNHLAYNIRLFSYLFNFVKLYGCLDRFSCLPYESELGHLKDYIHGPKPPAVQPCRRLVERFGLDAVEEGIFLDDVGLPLRPSATCGCHRFPHKGVIFSKNFPDNRILLDGKPVVIVDFSGSTIECQTFETFLPFYTHLVDSTDVLVFQCSDLQHTRFSASLNKISCKCLSFSYRQSRIYFPILHTLID